MEITGVDRASGTRSKQDSHVSRLRYPLPMYTLVKFLER